MMPGIIPCPNCGRPVSANAVDCSHCGANLALAALLAERQITITPRVPVEGPITPEILVPRLGDYLIERGVLSQENLQKALDYQAARETDGQPRLIGQALLDLKLIDREILDQVVTEQILQLQAALHKANRDLEDRVQQRTVELQQALNRLAELNQLKSNFIANISHELRTPLTHIKGYLELLVDDGLGSLNQQQADALAVMLRSEERLERLIEDLIQFSLVAQGDLNLQLTDFDAGEIIDELMLEYLPVCKNKSISLQTDFNRETLVVRGDRQKIGWVLSQLIDNAIKFTPSGGRVRLGFQLDGQFVSIYVLDTGIGISYEKIEEIFEPFHQLDNSATRRYGGTGLGLAMVRKIIETHGSQVVVKSKEGQGSYFEFKLPLVESR